MSSVLPPNITTTNNNNNNNNNNGGPSSKPSPTTNVKPNRLPAPTLFVGPPSRNASQLSISRQQPLDTNASNPKRDPLTRGKSALSRHTNLDSETTHPRDGAVGAGDAATVHSSSRAIPPPPQQQQQPLKKASETTVEAKWKAMQSTLDEVERTAHSSTHVFGETHAQALDDLRRAQVELARAWGRGNDDQHDPTDMSHSAADISLNRFQGADDLARERTKAARQQGRDQRARADTTASTASTALSDESFRSDVTSKSGGGGGGGGRSQLEDETAQDIKLASERRAANEAYFRKVDSGVRDVVARLEVVAEAMRGVEGESRSLWSSSSSGGASGIGSQTDLGSEEQQQQQQTGRGRERGRKESEGTAKG